MEAVRSWIMLRLFRQEFHEIYLAAWDDAMKKKGKIAPFGLFGGAVFT